LWPIFSSGSIFFFKLWPINFFPSFFLKETFFLSSSQTLLTLTLTKLVIFLWFRNLLNLWFCELIFYFDDKLKITFLWYLIFFFQVHIYTNIFLLGPCSYYFYSQTLHCWVSLSIIEVWLVFWSALAFVLSTLVYLSCSILF